MGMSAPMVQWFHRLFVRGILPRGGSIFELGPQDLATIPEVFSAVLKSIHGETASQWMTKLLSDPLGVKHFYEALGMPEYSSMDISDKRADLHFDLNYAFNGTKKYDVITNFGTSEHIANIGASFHTMHNLLKVGGLGLYVLPAFGDIDHGFFNIHPVFYREVANANQYIIEDWIYMDNFYTRHKMCEANPSKFLDFDALPVSRAEMVGGRAPYDLKATVNRVWAQNLISEETRTYGDVSQRMFDYCFVALRKTRDVPYVIPQQYAA